MGESAAASAEGAEAIFWNPAGLARMFANSPSDLSLSYSHLMQTAYSGTVAYARPSRLGIFAVGAIYFSQSAQTAYNLVGDPTGTFRPYDMALSLSYAGKINIVLCGATVKVIRSSLNDVSGVAGAVDFGAQVPHFSEAGEGAVDLGVAVMNWGTPIKVGTLPAPLPFHLRAGALWHAAPFLRGSFDVNMPVDDDPYVSFGAEGSVKLGAQKKWKASLRAGYNQRYVRRVEGLSAVTAGAGLDMDKMRVDYAWAPSGDLGITNRFTLGFRF